MVTITGNTRHIATIEITMEKCNLAHMARATGTTRAFISMIFSPKYKTMPGFGTAVAISRYLANKSGEDISATDLHDYLVTRLHKESY